MPVLVAWLQPAIDARKAELTARLGQSVTIRPVARRADGSVIRDGYGKPTYGALVTYPARVEGKNQLVRAATGDERASTTMVTLAGGPTIGTEDKLTLPDGSSPGIVAIATVPGASGTHMTILYL